VPLVYNGMEVCDSAESTDPGLFEKIPILWGIGKRRPECARFYRKMIALRKGNRALRRGDVTWLENSEPQKVVSFLRTSAGEQTLVVVNTASERVKALLPQPRLQGWLDVTPDLSTDAVATPSVVGGQTLELGPWGFKVLKRP